MHPPLVLSHQGVVIASPQPSLLHLILQGCVVLVHPAFEFLFLSILCLLLIEHLDPHIFSKPSLLYLLDLPLHLLFLHLVVKPLLVASLDPRHLLLLQVSFPLRHLLLLRHSPDILLLIPRSQGLHALAIHVAR